MEDGIGKGEMIKLISLVMKKMKKGLFPEETAELPEKDRYRYNVKDDRERFVMTVK